MKLIVPHIFVTCNSSGGKSTVVCTHSALGREGSLEIPGGDLGHRITHSLPYSLALAACHLCFEQCYLTGNLHWKMNACHSNYIFKKKKKI